MMTAPICFSNSQARSLPHRSDEIPSFPHSQFKFTTIGHISLDNLLPNKWDCQANSPQTQERRFDSCICFSFDCFWCYSSCSSACFFAPPQISSSVTRMTRFCFIWILLAVNTFYCGSCNFAVAALPPRAPQERLIEQIPTRGRSLHPPPQQLAQPLKGLQLFSNFMEQVDQVSTMNQD